MRKIKLIKWEEEDKNKKIIVTDTCKMFELIIQSQSPDKLPRGLDKFRIMGRITKAFDKARKTDVIELEEQDYSFLKKMLDSDIPAIWGQIPEAAKAIECFLEAKTEEIKTGE